MLMMLTANIHWCTEPEVSKEKAKPEPSNKGKMMTVVFIVQHAYLKTCITYRKMIESCTEAEAKAREKKSKPAPAKKGTVLMLCIWEGNSKRSW